MRFSFDGFDRYEIPTLTLADPNFSERCVIKNPKDLRASIRFNSTSDLSFYVDKTQATKHFFDLLVKKRLIHVDGFGWFVILNTEISSKGRTPRKTVNCVSYEAMLASRPVNLDAGTYIFYNPVSPSETLMSKLFGGMFTWSIAYVSPSLYGKARTFDLPDTDVYSFLTQDVAEAYECIFIFDNENRTVSAYTVDELIKESGVMMRFDTIMKSIQINESNEEIVTALSVYGASEFSINNVNPLGTPTIYKFDYYQHMMTPALWQAIQVWQSKIDVETISYANTLTNLKERNVEQLKLQSDLAKMKAILDSGKQVRDVQTPYSMQTPSNSAVSSISSWVNNSAISDLSALVLAATAYPAISFNSPPQAIANYVSSVATVDRGIAEALVNIWVCERVIVAQESAIVEKNDQIINLRNSLTAINSSLSVPNNFTLEQREELEKYIYGTDYTNEYCVITESMTYPEIQEIAIDLMEQGKNILERVSQVSYEFDLEAINYLFDKRFEGFINQTQLGHTIHAEISDGEWVTPILLEINLNWSAPDDFSMKFGNRFRLQSDQYIWKDLMDEMNKVSSAVSSEYSKLIEPSRSGLLDEVSSFLSNSLDASRNAILAGNNQSMVIDQHGFIGRKSILDANGNPTGFFEPKQFRMINDMLVFTDDNWQSCKLVLGNIDLGNGNSAYGLNTEVFMGKLLISNNLIMTNESGSFRFDGNGATLTNATLSVISSNRLSQILMDAANGFKIQSRTTTSQAFSDRLYIDTYGNLNMTGIINASSGTIGSWTINSDRLVNANRYVGMISDTGTNVVFYAGNSTPTSAPFRVLANGQLVATGADITGKINATSGTIGNWTIDADRIVNANRYVGMISATGTNVVFYAGSNDLPNAPFRVLANGSLFANNVNIKGSVEATSGKFTGEINATSGTFTGTVKAGSYIGGIGVQQDGLLSSEGNLMLNSMYITGIGNPTLGTYQPLMNFFVGSASPMGLSSDTVTINKTLNLSTTDYESSASQLGVTSSGKVVRTDSSKLNNISDRENGVDISGQIWASLQSGSDTAMHYGINTRRIVYLSSSIRYKKNIEEIEDEYSKNILNLIPVSFDYNNTDTLAPTKILGLIAEEVYKYYPELVGYKIMNNGKKIPETVKYEQLPIIMLKYIQNMNKRLEELERRL